MEKSAFKRDRREADRPCRPYIPPTFYGAICAAASSAWLLDGAWRSYAETGSVEIPVLRAGVVLSLAAGALVVCARRRDSRMLWAAAATLLAVLSSACWTVWIGGSMGEMLSRPVSSYVLVARGDPSVSSFGYSSTVDVLTAAGSKVGAARMTDDVPHEEGTVMSCVGRFKWLEADDWSRSRFMRGEVASLQVVRVVDEDDAGRIDPLDVVRRRALAVIDPSSGQDRALLAGIVCGRTTELSGSDANEAFSRCGLTHLVAVSGSHLAFISMLLELLLSKTRVSRRARFAILMAIMALYVVFTGGLPSAVRSVFMVACSMLSNLFGRRSHSLSGLSLSVIAMVLHDPGVVFDLGFQLSCGSVLFILLFGRYVAHLLARAGLPDAISDALSLTLVAQWATVPISLPVFGELSLIAPIANLVAGPLMSALLVAGLIGVAVSVCVPFAGLALIPSVWLANASVFAAELMASVPLASIPLTAPVWLCPLLYGLAVIVFLGWPDLGAWQARGALIAPVLAACAALVRSLCFAPPSVTVLDVGQGDSILVRDGSESLLIDAGVGDAVVAAVSRQGLLDLDAAVVTHWDSDHCGGFASLSHAMGVGELYVADGAADAAPEELAREFGGRMREIGYGDVMHVGGFSLEVVSPEGPVEGEENEDSLVMRLEYHGREGRGGVMPSLGSDDAAASGEAAETACSFSMALTGDAEAPQAAEFADRMGEVDVLKLGHHGSKASVDARMLETLDPKLSIASAGAQNRYGHPSPECIELVRASGSAFLCTKDVGDITIYPGEGGVRIVAGRPGALE